MPFRNIEGHFSKAPEVGVRRSRFKYNQPNKFTFNAGELVPFFVEEVLPGDTFNLKTSKVVRLTTSIHPTMDNLYIDTYYFFVPTRLVWDNWQAFMGENDKAWTQNITHLPPQFIIGGTGGGTEDGSYILNKIEPQSILNYISCPSFSQGSKKKVRISALDLNCYLKIFNDWFRSESLLDEVPIYQGDGPIPTSFYTAYQQYLLNNFGLVSVGYETGRSCLPVAKFGDYFTRALLQPQKGADVLIPAAGNLEFDMSNFGVGGYPHFVDSNGNAAAAGSISATSAPAVTDSGGAAVAYDPANTLNFNGLEITVNNLRLAMQTQRLLEKDARSGTRYIEIIKGHFGVTSPDARLQRSEYLGGKRTLINMSEVIQTSETTATSPLGQLAGRSLTNDVEDSFIKSFVEHGFIIGVCCVRPDRTYSQGIHRRSFRFDRLDYYFPVLANIGEQPIYEREIFLPNLAESVAADDVFGYQEAWAEYRTQQGKLKGYMQPGITGTLASWNYGDDYAQSPVLSPAWLYQGKNEIDRTLAIPSTTAPQFIADFLTYGSVTRPMPIYSIPGLVDHN